MSKNLKCENCIENEMIEFGNPLNRMPIYIATKCIQKRKHHKKRINKKWAKRYGFYELNYIPHGCPMLIDGAIWMTKRDFDSFMPLKRKKWR